MSFSFSKKNPTMLLVTQINNLQILHDAKGSGSVFVKTPNGTVLEEYKTKPDNSNLDERWSLNPHGAATPHARMFRKERSAVRCGDIAQGARHLGAPGRKCPKGLSRRAAPNVVSPLACSHRYSLR